MGQPQSKIIGVRDKYEDMIREHFQEKINQKFLVLMEGFDPKANLTKKHRNCAIKDDILKLKPKTSKFQRHNCKRENIITVDDRIQVNPNLYPFSAIGYLVITMSTKQIFHGTAFLVAENLVMTCAHNCYDQVKQKRVQRLQFYPGLDGNSGRMFEVQKFYIPEEYIKNPETESPYDFAILELKQNAGKTYGFFGLDFTANKKSDIINIFGYPGNVYRNFQTQVVAQHMFGQSGEWILKNSLIKYKIATSTGQSGCPIYIEVNGKYFVIGIHTCGDTQINCGVYLNEKVRNYVNRWLISIKTSLDLRNKLLQDSFVTKLTARNELSGLHKIILDENLLTAKGVSILSNGQWNNLEIISLANNKIDDEGLYYLCQKKWTNIIEINLGSNQITDNGIKHLQKSWFPNLQSLCLSHNKITDLGLIALKKIKFTNLKELSLSDNDITDQGIISGNFEAWPNLLWLYLANIKITDKGVIYLKQYDWQTIQNISLVHNPRISEGLSKQISHQRPKNKENKKITFRF